VCVCVCVCVCACVCLLLCPLAPQEESKHLVTQEGLLPAVWVLVPCALDQSTVLHRSGNHVHAVWLLVTQREGSHPAAGVQVFVPRALEQSTTSEEPHVSQSK